MPLCNCLISCLPRNEYWSLKTFPVCITFFVIRQMLTNSKIDYNCASLNFRMLLDLFPEAKSIQFALYHFTLSPQTSSPSVFHFSVNGAIPQPVTSSGLSETSQTLSSPLLPTSCCSMTLVHLASSCSSPPSVCHRLQASSLIPHL